MLGTPHPHPRSLKAHLHKIKQKAHQTGRTNQRTPPLPGQAPAPIGAFCPHPLHLLLASVFMAIVLMAMLSFGGSSWDCRPDEKGFVGPHLNQDIGRQGTLQLSP